MDRIVVKRSRGLSGTIRVPGDKSITHRAVILGSIASGKTKVHGYLRSEDCISTIQAFRAMGVEITEKKNGRLIIRGKGLTGLKEPVDVLNLGNSGTSLRLLTGLLAGQRFFSVLTGDASLKTRPMRRLLEPLKKMGAEIRGRDEGDHAPVAIQGRELHGIAYSLPVASAQLKSGLLLAGLMASGKTTIDEPVLSRDHTERMLDYLGVHLSLRGSTISIDGRTEFNSKEIRVPGDFSSAAFFIVAALICPNSDVEIKNVGLNPTRTGLIDVLAKMGGRIDIRNQRTQSGEPVGDLVVRSSPLSGLTVEGDIIPRMIDELPILCVAAAVADGETAIRDARELRFKETDRIKTISRGLRLMGVRVKELPDGMKITGGRPLSGAVCKSSGDHRIAMAMTIAGLVAKGRTVVADTACIVTSFPGFEKTIRGISRLHAAGRRSQV
jgi:3-phosphoshikimate 1-carboxyvinyltransferase